MYIYVRIYIVKGIPAIREVPTVNRIPTRGTSNNIPASIKISHRHTKRIIGYHMTNCILKTLGIPKHRENTKCQQEYTSKGIQARVFTYADKVYACHNTQGMHIPGDAKNTARVYQ